MKIEVDITKPPKEEAARIEKLLTELAKEKPNRSIEGEASKNLQQEAIKRMNGMFSDVFAGIDAVELQRKWRSEWE